MWPATTVVPAGNPVKFATNVAGAAVMLPAASFVTSNVIVTVPLPEASGPTIGGTSLDGNSVAVNVGFVGEDGDVDDEPHPAARNASAASADRRFIVTTFLRKTCAPG